MGPGIVHVWWTRLRGDEKICCHNCGASFAGECGLGPSQAFWGHSELHCDPQRKGLLRSGGAGHKAGNCSYLGEVVIESSSFKACVFASGDSLTRRPAMWQICEGESLLKSQSLSVIWWQTLDCNSHLRQATKSWPENLEWQVPPWGSTSRSSRRSHCLFQRLRYVLQVSLRRTFCWQSSDSHGHTWLLKEPWSKTMSRFSSKEKFLLQKMFSNRNSLKNNASSSHLASWNRSFFLGDWPCLIVFQKHTLFLQKMLSNLHSYKTTWHVEMVWNHKIGNMFVSSSWRTDLRKQQSRCLQNQLLFYKTLVPREAFAWFRLHVPNIHTLAAADAWEAGHGWWNFLGETREEQCILRVEWRVGLHCNQEIRFHVGIFDVVSEL